MNNFAYVLAVFVIFVGIFGLCFINRLITVRRYRVCPVCAHKTVVQHRSRDIDPKQERVTIGRNRILGGHAKEYWSVIYCENCGYERKI